MKPVSDMPCGSASSLTVHAPSSNCRSTLRRVESARAPKTVSRWDSSS
jgi:hypothetical protein